MMRPALAISALAVALIGSNAWWAYRNLDAGVTATYRQVSLEDHRTALAQVLAILPIAVRPGATRAEIFGGGSTRRQDGALRERRLCVGGTSRPKV